MYDSNTSYGVRKEAKSLESSSPKGCLTCTGIWGNYLYSWFPVNGGRSGGAMVLGKLPVPGRPTIWITVGQGPTALVVGAGGGCLDIFTLIYPFLFSFSLSLGDGPI